MNIFFIFLIGYILSFFGFVLAKATKEEFVELKNIIPKLNEIYLMIVYILFLYFFSSFSLMIFLFISFVCFAISKVFKEFIDFHNILFFTITSVISLSSDIYKYLFVLPLIYLFISNSFKKFLLKEKLYEIIFSIFIFLILNVIIS